MRSTMDYMVAMEDGEIVKMTADGFESTGMYIMPFGEAPAPYALVSRSELIKANA